MNTEEVGKHWNDNAEVWTLLARKGYDVYRDQLNTPAFMATLPDVKGLYGIDIGCGEGHNTRLLARRGAMMVGVDIAENFIREVEKEEERERLGIEYYVADAVHLPFAANNFDFATGFMSFMDIPDTEGLLAEVYRIINTGGFLQFSIAHPCFTTPHRKNLRDATGQTYAVEVGHYFYLLDGEIDEWLFSNVPPAMKASLRKFKVPLFNRTLSQWINGLVKTGFVLEAVHEPMPCNEVVARFPFLQDAQVVAYFLHLRCRKPLA